MQHLGMVGRNVAILGLVLTILGLVPDAGAATKIDVLINIIADTGVTEEQARDAVREASRILTSQLDVRLNVVKVNQNVPLAGFAQDPPGSMEVEDIRKFAPGFLQASQNEIVNNTENDKAIKLIFLKTINATFVNSDTGELRRMRDAMGGYAVHQLPIAFIPGSTILPGGGFGPRQARAMGESIAHEIGHMVTLLGEYQIDERTNSDAGGHAPDKKGSAGNENLMAPAATRRGTTLTRAQKERIRTHKLLEEYGKSVSQITPLTPGEKLAQQHGLGVDALGDPSAALAYLDLLATRITSVQDDPEIRATVTLAGLLPSAGPFDAIYGLLFDIDGNPTTGVEHPAGFAGVEREVRLSVQVPAFGPPVVFAGVIDLLTESVTLLPTLPALRRSVDTDAPDGGVPLIDTIQLDVPKSLLGFTAMEVPVGVFSASSLGLHDTASLVFDQERWLKDATLQLFDGAVEAGQPVAFSVSGLAPNAAFDFYLDETRLFGGVLGPAGDAEGIFAFPVLPPGQFSAILTVQDATGEAAFNVLNNAGTVVALSLNQHAAAPGDVQQLDLSVSNLGSPRMVDVYFLAVLPPGAAAGCASGEGVIFLADAFSRAVTTCLAALPEGAAPLLSDLAIPGGLSRTDVLSFFAFAWPTDLPAGDYTFALVVTTAGALSDASLDEGELLAVTSDTVQFAPTPGGV